MSDQYALIPKYMGSFQCIGAECEDTCCARWNVAVDKRTYQVYTNIADKEWRNKFKSSLIKNEKKNSNIEYAKMKLNPQTGDCSMLEGGLCTIQARLGEEYLCPTCATYPRYVNEVDGVQEISAAPSCPEAARLILLEPAGIEFIQMDPLRAKNIRPYRQLSTAAGNLTAYFWDLRIASIEILQDRRFSLTHRLLRLGWLSEYISDIVAKGQFDKVKDAVMLCKDELETNTELNDYNAFPANEEFQLLFLNKLIVESAGKSISNKRYRECLDEYISGMGSCDFKFAFHEYYMPYMKKNEHILENYMVNAVYYSLFPMARHLNMFDQYVLMVINYALIQMHLIGIAANRKELNDEIAVKLIQSFAKNYEHNNSFLQTVYDRLKTEKYDTLGHLSLLIKI